jgi:hypothetical protein
MKLEFGVNHFEPTSIILLPLTSISQLAVRKSHDPHTQWVLSGVVVRIAQRLGLHRDGSNLKLSPFDAEIRRRTWWQIVFLDGHASRLAGAGFPTWAKFDTKPPLNISDSDISPTMKDPPLEKEGATEMIFCCLRYEVGQALRKAGTPLRSDDSTWRNPYEVGLIEQKDKAIDELEVLFEKKFVRYCDPAIPLHYLVTVVAKSVIGTFRIMAVSRVPLLLYLQNAISSILQLALQLWPLFL